MTEKENEQFIKDFEEISKEIKEKYGVGEAKRIDISRMTDEDLKKVSKLFEKIPLGSIDKAPFTQDFILNIIWENIKRDI